jgi:hypothetical protein
LGFSRIKNRARARLLQHQCITGAVVPVLIYILSNYLDTIRLYPEI